MASAISGLLHNGTHPETAGHYRTSETAADRYISDPAPRSQAPVLQGSRYVPDCLPPEAHWPLADPETSPQRRPDTNRDVLHL